MKHQTLISICLAAAVGYAVHAAIVSPLTETSQEETEMDTMASPSASQTMAMSPEPIPHPSDTPVPSVTITETIPDRMGTYGVRVALEYFTITPEKIDQEPVPNEGHLHVYVDGVKVGREYAEWIYLPSEYFTETGPHRITVSLNANTHGAWTFAGAPIEDTVVVE